MKIIDKYLDNYYAFKLAENIRWHLVLVCNADCKVEKISGEHWAILSKRRNLNERFYTEVYSFSSASALELLCDLEGVQKFVRSRWSALMDRQKGDL